MTDRRPFARGSSALCLTALLSRTGPVRGEDADEAVRKQRRQQIAGMSETERARLKKNMERFRKLSPQDQEKLRRLDRDLKANEDLRPTMKEYIDWLETLSAGERGDLRSEPAADHRAKQVRELIEEQHQRVDRPPLRTPPPALGPADLDAVLKVVEDQMLELGLKTGQQLSELRPLQGLQRHSAVLEMAFAWPPVNRSEPPAGRGELPPGRGDSPPPRIEPPPFWKFPSPLVDEIIGLIVNNEHRQYAQRGENPRDRHFRLFSLIFFGVKAEYEGLPKPSEETLIRFLADLKSTQQDEILRRTDIDRQQQMLLEKYMEANPDDYPKPPPWDRISFGGGGRRGRRGGGPPPDGMAPRGGQFPRDAGQGRGQGNRRGGTQSERDGSTP